MKKYNYLNDRPFLMEVFQERNLHQYIKITALTFTERPIQEIQGRVTGGNLSLNGDSAIRRTANLNVFIEEDEANYYDLKNLFTINKKFRIEIGIGNFSKKYLDAPILWFPLGTYALMSLSLSHDINGTNASLQLKDKMVFLNGECGGTISASTIFHEYEILDPFTGEYVIEKPTIVQIIRELVNHFGGEALNKIIINDIDTRVKRVMKWTLATPLYSYEQGNKNVLYTMDLDKIAADLGKENIVEGIDYKVYEAGDDVGFQYTDFVYPGELIGDASSTVSSILDTIKNTLGNYEYYYDIYGNFIFQEIKNYLNTSKSTVDLNNMKQQDYVVDRTLGKAVYKFDNSYITTSYSNAPQFAMVKNDFVIWGMRESIDGGKLPIRYHLAIDAKPKVGNTYEICRYVQKNTATQKDEIIYKKTTDFPTKDSFPETGDVIRAYRALDKNFVSLWSPTEHKYVEAKEQKMLTITTNDWRTELYLSGMEASKFGTDSNPYYAALVNEWPKLFDIEQGKFKQEVVDHPSEIDYYLDFIDSSAAISELSVSNIGRRTKVVNDEKINCIFEQEIPDYILIAIGEDLSLVEQEQNECINKGQDYIMVNMDVYEGLAMGGSLNSAYNTVKDLLYQHTSYNESITVQMLPLYFLEPNMRITVQDKDSGIHGDYMIKSISLPFEPSGTMSLTCSRVLERI